jgi:hypothetical protein
MQKIKVLGPPIVLVPRHTLIWQLSDPTGQHNCRRPYAASQQDDTIQATSPEPAAPLIAGLIILTSIRLQGLLKVENAQQEALSDLEQHFSKVTSKKYRPASAPCGRWFLGPS